jgi:hypothetical protein
MSLVIGRSFEEKHRILYISPLLCRICNVYAHLFSFHIPTSLGAALSQLFSFELAGEGVNSDWVPKPITCISYAAPRSGSGGYRTAVEVRMI